MQALMRCIRRQRNTRAVCPRVEPCISGGCSTYGVGKSKRMKTIRAIGRFIDFISENSGKAVSWIIPVLICLTVYEVFMRYVLDRAVVFAYDVSWMLGATVYVVALGWVSQRNEHIRVDVLYLRFSQRTRVLLDIILSLIVFFPLGALLLYAATNEAIRSVVTGELSSVSYWRPPMFPFRIMLAVGLCILFLQEIANLAHNIYFLASRGREP